MQRKKYAVTEDNQTQLEEFVKEKFPAPRVKEKAIKLKKKTWEFSNDFSEFDEELTEKKSKGIVNLQESRENQAHLLNKIVRTREDLKNIKENNQIQNDDIINAKIDLLDACAKYLIGINNSAAVMRVFDKDGKNAFASFKKNKLFVSGDNIENLFSQVKNIPDKQRNLPSYLETFFEPTKESGHILKNK